VELNSLLTEEKLAGVPVLIYANKQDLISALPAKEVRGEALCVITLHRYCLHYCSCNFSSSLYRNRLDARVPCGIRSLTIRHNSRMMCLCSAAGRGADATQHPRSSMDHSGLQCQDRGRPASRYRLGGTADGQEEVMSTLSLMVLN